MKITRTICSGVRANPSFRPKYPGHRSLFERYEEEGGDFSKEIEIYRKQSKNRAVLKELMAKETEDILSWSICSSRLSVTIYDVGAESMRIKHI